MNEVALTPAPGEISVRTGDPLYGTLVGVEAPLVHYLLEELITQRLENGQLNADLAAAGAQRAEIEKAAREKEAALAAWIASLHDELAQRQAQLATAARVSATRVLEEARAAEASARARRQLAAMKIKREEQDRQLSIVQSLAENLEQRLRGAEAELQRRDTENERLTSELRARRMRTHSAMVLAHPTAVLIEDQRDALPERTEQRPELLSATSVEVAPTMPHPKPRLRASGGAAHGEVHVALEDAEQIQAGLRDVAVRDWEPTIDKLASSASESLGIPDIMSTADVAPKPFISRMLEAGKEGSTALDEGAARLADGLRATREEAIRQQQEQVFTVDVQKRAFASSRTDSVPLDPALELSLLTAKSELLDESTGGIRFFPDGSSTGGRIELGLLGDRAAINVRWSTGAVTVER